MSSSNLAGNESCLKVDRISKLPDSVLCHILSFMETKYSIQTCVLSRRWKSLWTYVPCLYFARVSSTDVYVRRCSSDVNFQITIHNQPAFEKLVTMSLFMNRCQSLDRFSLACFVNADKLNLFPSWISIVSTKTVRLLDLNLVSSNGISRLINLPSCIFTLESMEILRLQGDLLVGTSGLISLPRLKCLSLKGVKYVCDDSVRKLIEGCTVLKSLYIERNNGYDNVTVFTVSSDTLEHLEIIAGGFASVHGNINLKLEIEAPYLKFLCLCDYVSKDFSFQSLPLLNELHLFSFNNPIMYNPAFTDKKEDSNFLSPDKLAEFGVLDFEYPNLLNDCKWVLDLVDEKLGEELKILSIGNEDILYYIAESRKVFSKLTNFRLFPYWEWRTLLAVLDKTKNLKVLILRANCQDFNENSDKEIAPACFASSLQRITVISWLDSLDDGDCSLEDMVGIVKYFLKHGKILERLDLSDHCEGEVSLSLQKEFLELSRKSSACEVHIVYESPPVFVYSDTYELPLL